MSSLDSAFAKDTVLVCNRDSKCEHQGKMFVQSDGYTDAANNVNIACAAPSPPKVSRSSDLVKIMALAAGLNDTTLYDEKACFCGNYAHPILPSGHKYTLSMNSPTQDKFKPLELNLKLRNTGLGATKPTKLGEGAAVDRMSEKDANDPRLSCEWNLVFDYRICHDARNQVQCRPNKDSCKCGETESCVMKRDMQIKLAYESGLVECGRATLAIDGAVRGLFQWVVGMHAQTALQPCWGYCSGSPVFSASGRGMTLCPGGEVTMRGGNSE